MVDSMDVVVTMLPSDSASLDNDVNELDLEVTILASDSASNDND